jgi:ABC-type Mn2+/Zn2+ transport system ATPase subunit
MEAKQRSPTCAVILERTELISKANTPAGGLSLLERKRLELARAMATHPKLLLLDEIAGGLTDAECQSLIETIKAIHAEGVTIIWIEHVLHALNSAWSNGCWFSISARSSASASRRRSWSPKRSGKSTWGSRYDRAPRNHGI